MSVITISREFGSEGGVITEKVAQTLGYHFADKSTIGRVLSQYGLVEFGTEYDSLPDFWARFDAHREERREVMVKMLNRVIEALAQHGNVVILGRGSFAVLSGLADVLNVRVQAPFQTRVDRVMEREKITQVEQAEALVKENDRVRAAFVESAYGVQWDSVSAFDLVINTGKVSPELAAAWLVEAVKSLMDRKGTNERTTKLIQVDAVLASTISEALKCQVAH